MKKKTSKDAAASTRTKDADQLELPLSVRAAAAVLAFPKPRTQPRESGDAAKRILEFAARLPDW